MVATTLALVLALAQRSDDQYTLTAAGEGFLVRHGAQRETVPLALPKPKKKAFLSFRRDRRFVVWDERGLTVRDGEWTFNDRLEAVATSPRAQDRDAIRDTLEAVKAGRRRRAASGLSGARRIGGSVYLLARWDEKGGEPWLEALVAVDLSKPKPKPRLVGTFGGISLGRGRVDDRLAIQDGRLAVAANGPDGWGVATYDPKAKAFGFDPRGGRLVSLEGDKVVEETPYGTLVAGRRENGRTVGWLETRGPVEFVPGEGPALVLVGGRLHNAETGAEFRLARGAAVRRAASGILVFWPESSPRSARLLDPDRLEERARWEKGTKRAEGKERG